MSKELTNLGITMSDGFITSVDLVEIINYFRAFERESGLTGRLQNPLQHKDLLTKIRKEIEVLKNAGLEHEREFTPGSYTDKQNQKRPCYLLNKDGMLMMLNSESTLVRYKTVEYINKLEEQLKQLQTPSYMIDDKIARAERWIIEEKQRQALCEKVQELKPKAEYYDDVLASDGLLTPTQIAKEFGMTGRKLNELLNELGVQYKQGKIWVLYAKYADKGYTKYVTHLVQRAGSVTYTSVTCSKWTQKGRKFLHDILAENGIYPIC